IDTPGGVRIATDFNGAYRTGRLPDVVTMNRAHSTHYTLFPDPKIKHVLQGWGENGQPAHIGLRVDDAYTMSLDGVSEITRRLRSSVVLPMHRFATPLEEFMRLIGQQFAIDQRGERTLKISRDTLPSTPTVIILDGV